MSNLTIDPNRRRVTETWDDLYAHGGKRTGVRCDARHPTLPAIRCMHNDGHAGQHRYTSRADGRSVSWDD